MKTKGSATVDQRRRDLILGRFQADRGGVSAVARSSTVAPGVAVLSRTACIAWNGVVCMSCVYSCDDRAIRMDSRGRPEIIEAACTGCAACVDVCPTRAIMASSRRGDNVQALPNGASEGESSKKVR